MAEILHKDLIGEDIHELRVTLGSGVPTTIPLFVGQGYYDFVNKKFYVAQGIALVADWLTTDIPPFLTFLDTTTIAWTATPIGDDIVYTANVQEANLVLTAANITDFADAVNDVPEIIDLEAKKHTALILRTGGESNPGIWSPANFNGLELDSSAQKIKLSQDLSTFGTPTLSEVTLTVRSRTPVLTLTAGGTAAAASLFLDTTKGMVVRGNGGSTSSFTLQNQTGTDVLSNPVSTNQLKASSLAGASAPYLVHSDVNGLLSASKLVNADVSSSAAIAGTKISPDFGSQNIVTTGSVLVDDIESNTNDIGILTGNTNKTIAIGTGSGYNTINIGGVNSTVNIQGAVFTTPVEYVSEDKNIVVNFNASGQNSPDSGLYVQEQYDGASLTLTSATWQSGNTVRYVFSSSAEGLTAGEYIRITGFVNAENNGTYKVLTVNLAPNYIDVVNPERTNATKNETGVTASGARLLLNGYIHIGSTRMSWEVKAPAHSGVIELKPQPTANTLLLTSESASDVTVKFNTNLTVDQDLQKTSSVEFANIKATDLGVGVVHSDIDGNFSSSLIVDNDVSGTAAIAGTKIVPSFGGQAITTTAGATLGSVKITGTEAVGGSNLYTTATDGLVARGIAGTGSQFKFISSTGTSLVTITSTNITLHALTTGIVKASSGVLSASLLVNADVSASAAIAGTKISPNFGSQNIVTTGSATANSAIISGLSTGIVHSNASGNLTSSAIVDADVSALAGIAGTKISPNFGSQNIQTTGTVTSVGMTVAGFSTGIVHSDASGIFSSSAIVDADVSALAGIAGTKISPNFGSQNIVTTGSATANSAIISGLSTGIVHSDASGNLTSSVIVNADVSASAAIAGTKISPNFGSQTITTTGNTTTNTATISSFATAGVVHNSAAGVLSTSLIVNADITNATITDAKLATISTAGKVLNSATTATNLNTASAIVARDANGDFVARKIQATDILATSNALNLGTSADTITVLGDFVVQGNTVTLNTATLNVEDKNITLNRNGTTAAAADAGLTIEGTGATSIAGLLYDSALVSKFKLGATGLESEVITTAGTQQINSKTASALTVSDYEDLQGVVSSATPAANYVRFYAKTDGKLYLKASDGVEFLIRTGADPYTPTTSSIADYHFEAASLNGTAVFSNAETTLNYDFWSGTGPLSTWKNSLNAAGTQNAGLAFGGANDSIGRTAVTEKFNGSAWSTTGSLGTARSYAGGAGVQNAALTFGGYDASLNPIAITEKFNGSAWSTTGSLGTVRTELAGAGVQNAALAFGGTNPLTSATEKFNGNTWATNSVWNLSTQKYGLAGAGTQNAGLAFGGYFSTFLSSTEKFNGNVWSLAGNLAVSKNNLGGAGTQNAALAFGGYNGSYLKFTEKFNGNVWQLTGAMTAAKDGLAGTGTQNAALAIGGYEEVNGHVSTTEKFHGQLQHGFAGLFKGSTNTLNINSSDDAITMNLGSEAGILQLDVLFDINGGLSSQERLWITELEKESRQSGTWSVNSYINTARAALAGAGTQNAALAFGGTTGSASAVTEKFDGNAWTNVTSPLLTARYELAGAGIQNAALSFGGFSVSIVPTSQKFGGTTWSSTGALVTARRGLAGAGTQNTALAIGGFIGAGSANASSIVEKFNGSAWSQTGNLSEVCGYLAGAGTQNAGLTFGGVNSSGFRAKAAKFAGNTWSETNSLNIAREVMGTGTQNNALAFGGSTGTASAVTEKFNGSAWSIDGNLSIIRERSASSGTQNAALVAGGYTTGAALTAIAEKFNYNLEFIPRTSGNGTWTSSGILNEARYNLAGAGTQNAGLAFGGYTSTYSSTTEKFNGTSWTSVASSLLTARTGLGGIGTQNAALAFGGEISGGSTTQLTQRFNGTVWSSTGNIGARKYLAAAGTQYAGLAFGGSAGLQSEKFNGSAWSISGNLSAAKSYLAGTGTQNAALAIGSFGGLDSLEVFNGFTWSISSNLNREKLAASGSQNATIAFGGNDGTNILSTAQKYNGYVWAATTSMGTARSDLGGLGSQNTALAFGGATSGPTASAVTEKYNEITINSLQIN